MSVEGEEHDGDAGGIDCRGAWGPWAECDASCGHGGIRLRYFVLQEPTSEGNDGDPPCPYDQGTPQYETCNDVPCCPGAWDAWGACDCEGSGTSIRTWIASTESCNSTVPFAEATACSSTCPHASFTALPVTEPTWSVGGYIGLTVALCLGTGALIAVISWVIYRHRMKSRQSMRYIRPRQFRQHQPPSDNAALRRRYSQPQPSGVPTDIETGLPPRRKSSENVEDTIGSINEIVVQKTTDFTDLRSMRLPNESLYVHSATPTLGSGGDGQVFHCELLTDVDLCWQPDAVEAESTNPTSCGASLKQGTAVALKELYSMVMDNDVKDFAAELAFLVSLKHEHIIPFYGIFVQKHENDEHEHRYFIVSKFAENGDLSKQLVRPYSEVDFHTRRRWLVQVASAIAYMHSVEVVHRDIKPQNVLIDGESKCLVTDFGVSRRLVSSPRARKLAGTWAFMPPEVIGGTLIADLDSWCAAASVDVDDTSPSPFAFAWDMFSYAILVAATFNAKYPYQGERARSLRARVVTRGLRPQLPKMLTAEAHVFLQQMWHADPAQRPTFADILERARSGLFRMDRRINIQVIKRTMSSPNSVCTDCPSPMESPLSSPTRSPSELTVRTSSFESSDESSDSLDSAKLVQHSGPTVRHPQDFPIYNDAVATRLERLRAGRQVRWDPRWTWPPKCVRVETLDGESADTELHSAALRTLSESVEF